MINLFCKPYRLIHDFDKDKPTLDLSVDAEIIKANNEGYGVFAKINHGQGYKDQDINTVVAWWVDIDFKDVEKPIIDDVFEFLPLIPSVVVETKNGYHIYYLAKNGRTENFKTIQKALVKLIPGADPKVTNLARIMRVPEFDHMKEPTHPFKVEVIFSADVSYLERQLLELVSDDDEDAEESATSLSVYTKSDDSNIFDRIRHHDSRDILQRLSGSAAVGHKQYKFKRAPNNHYNIIVDGKDSGCFINGSGNVIGSDGYSGGAVEWLKFYGHSRVDAMQIIKGVMGWD